MKSVVLFVCIFFAFNGITKAQSKKEDPNIMLGQKSIMDGDFKSAIGYLEKSLNTDANNPDVLYTLGYSYYQTADYTKAINSLSKAISVRPEKGNAYYYRGKARNKMAVNMNTNLSAVERDKLLQASIKDFSKCIELNPQGNLEYYQNRAIAYRDYAILKEQKTAANYDKAIAESAYKSCISDLQFILDSNPTRKDIADELKKAKVYMANLNNK
jgi:tetratricopeptide (TPR) repeat protein